MVSYTHISHIYRVIGTYANNCVLVHKTLYKAVASGTNNSSGFGYKQRRLLEYEIMNTEHGSIRTVSNPQT